MPDSHTHEDLKQSAWLWDSYWQGGKSIAMRDELVRHFYHLVGRLVLRMRRGLAYHVDPDLGESAAAQGLVEAVEQFDTKKSNNFPAYAQTVMRRRVVDALRRHNASPCQIAERAGMQREKDEMTLSQQLGRRPSQEELDQFVRLSVEHGEVETARKPRSTRRTNRGPDKPASSNDRTHGVVRFLDVRAAAILHLYVCGNFSQSEIAELFGITQVRVCQIVHQARKAYAPHEYIYRGRRKDGPSR